MLIGDILVAQGLVTPIDVSAALERQRTEGGKLGDNLVTMGKLSPADLAAVLDSTPIPPNSLEATGLALSDLSTS